jgi:C-terminal processing protease CtpA/Prc
MPRMPPPILLSVFLLVSAGVRASPQDDAPVRMAPVSVTAGPLGFLGIKCDVDADAGFFGHVSNTTRIKGMVIAEVIRNSPAQAAGLMPKDRVLQIDGTPITDYTIGALKGVRGKEKGDKMVFVVCDADSRIPRTVEITVGALKSPSK